METPRSRRDDDVLDEAAVEVSPSHGPKRRKIRKGTQSCWECKRRKIRCVLASPPSDTAVCIGCRRRGTRCVGQEFPDEPSPIAGDGHGGGSGRHVLERLSRMEMVIEKLAQKAGIDGEELLSSLATEPRVESRPHTIAGDHASFNASTSALRRPVIIPPIQGKLALDRYHDELSRALLAAWPCRHDLDLLFSIPGVTMPYYTMSMRPDTTPSSPQDLLQPPTAGSHPLLLARKLLHLAAFLQNIPPGSVAARTLQANLSVPCNDLMTHAVETAVNLVISNDELVQSVQGIESVWMESMYQNSAGNLRRAFLATRRAMTLAQTMGLHREVVSTSSLCVLEPRALASSLEPKYLWFRIVQSDRYLSMMLGLPQGTIENIFAKPSALETCSPIERMQRLTSVAGGRILERNGSGRPCDLTATAEIDGLLHKAAAEMTSQWWLTPRFAIDSDDDPETVRRETMRVMEQLSYYHLLSQLYFPFLLQDTSPSTLYTYDGHNVEYDHKLMAIHASREVLTRFVAFRETRPISPCCGGVDYLAFIACIALCLAHIDNCSGPKLHGSHAFSFLAHQRRCDVGLMERTLEIMDSGAKQASSNVIASKIAKFLQQLLAIEGDAASGESYSIISSSGRENDEAVEDLGCNSKASDGGKKLRIYIPSCATITIERINTVDTADGGLIQDISMLMPWTIDNMDDGCFRDPNMAFLETSTTS